MFEDIEISIKLLDIQAPLITLKNEEKRITIYSIAS